MRKRGVTIQFPLAGLNERLAFQNQPPFSTPKAENVRAEAGLENRIRGGRRPGLLPVMGLGDDLYGDNYVTDKINMLTEVGGLRAKWRQWRDDLNAPVLSDVWTQASDVAYGGQPNQYDNGSWGGPADGTGVSALLPAISDMDKDGDIRLLVFLRVDGTAWGSAGNEQNFQLHMQLNDVTPGVDISGVSRPIGLHAHVQLSGGDLTATIYANDGATDEVVAGPSTIGITAASGWIDFQAYNNGGTDTAGVFFRGRHVASGSLASQNRNNMGTRFGWVNDNNYDSDTNTIGVDEVQYGYTTTGSEYNVPAYRNIVAVAGGDIYQQRLSSPHLWPANGTPHGLDTDGEIGVASLFGKLYIVDGREILAGPDTARWNPVTGKLVDDFKDFTALGVTADRHVVSIFAQGTGEDGGRDAALGTYNISSVGTDTLTLVQAPHPDGEVSVQYRVERGILQYDPDTRTTAALIAKQATAGETFQGIPYGASLICVYRGRLVVAAGEGQEHMWYMSRAFDQEDWDTGADLEDTQRPVFGSLAEAGGGNQPITALIPFSDDYLVMGCQRSLWIMRGDPAAGGIIDSISDVVGVISANAWCKGPSSELYFLSHAGLYHLPPGANVYPERVSEDIIPKRLLTIPTQSVRATLEYDAEARGVHIFLSGILDDRESYHWFVDTNTGGFWPVTIHGQYDPFSAVSKSSSEDFDTGVLLGGRDGFIRRFDNRVFWDGDNDSGLNSYGGTEEDSEVWIGPIKMGDGNDADGVMLELVGTLGALSSRVEWQLYVGNSPEEAFLSSSPADNGAFFAGYNLRYRPRVRGSCFFIKLFTDGGALSGMWAFETAYAVFRMAGQRRLP
jgi:hypothetical protein